MKYICGHTFGLHMKISSAVRNISNLSFRNVVYFNYVDFCGKSGMLPVNAASFGKVNTTRVLPRGSPFLSLWRAGDFSR